MNPSDEIAKTAYELFEKSGRVHGRDVENWLEAERIVKAMSRESEKREARKPASPAAKKTEARR
ncbi:MAG TPA: DUF2934 domain-containing protein [Thermodesulfobacteriota bacterium]|nr:DUF2934 domain-containing protein [Thermodesulfobacteriota bacterium]